MLAEAGRVNADHVQTDEVEVGLLQPSQPVRGLHRVGTERPGQHDPVTQVVLLVPKRFAHRVGERLHIGRRDRLLLVSLANPDRYGTFVAMDSGLMFLSYRTEGPQNKGAELIAGGIGQSPGLVHPPMFDREVGNRKEFAGMLLNLPGKPVGCDRDSHTGLVASDPTTAQALGYCCRRTATCKEISDDVPLV